MRRQQLNGGGQLAVSVYVKASTRQDAVRDSLIARNARATEIKRRLVSFKDTSD
jgi:hypothetical protein